MTFPRTGLGGDLPGRLPHHISASRWVLALVIAAILVVLLNLVWIKWEPILGWDESVFYGTFVLAVLFAGLVARARRPVEWAIAFFGVLDLVILFTLILFGATR